MSSEESQTGGFQFVDDARGSWASYKQTTHNSWKTMRASTENKYTTKDANCSLTRFIQRFGLVQHQSWYHSITFLSFTRWNNGCFPAKPFQLTRGDTNQGITTHKTTVCTFRIELSWFTCAKNCRERWTERILSSIKSGKYWRKLGRIVILV